MVKSCNKWLIEAKNNLEICIMWEALLLGPGSSSFNIPLSYPAPGLIA